MALFESYERRIDKINSVLSNAGIASLVKEKTRRCDLDGVRHGKRHSAYLL